MIAADWLPAGIGALFGLGSIAAVVSARRLPRELRYEVYGYAAIGAAACLGMLGPSFLPAHSRWDGWIVGLYIAMLLAALGMIRRGRQARARWQGTRNASENAAPPSNDR